MWQRGRMLFGLDREQQSNSIQASGNILRRSWSQLYQGRPATSFSSAPLCAEPQAVALSSMSGQRERDLCVLLYAVPDPLPHLGSQSGSGEEQKAPARLAPSLPAAWPGCSALTGTAPQHC